MRSPIKNISRFVGAAALVMAANVPARAQVLLTANTWENGVGGVSFQNNGAVPDGNPVGWADTRLISTPANQSILQVTVTLQIDSGFNGDLYAYLRAPDGSMAVLLNRVGSTSSDSFGYSDPGMVVTLKDGAATDIHTYQNATFTLDTSGRLTGEWQADGRSAATGVTDASSRNARLSSLKGGLPDGYWTLYVADLSAGEQSAVQGWGVQLTVVPEPAEITLAASGMLGALAIFRTLRKRR